MAPGQTHVHRIKYTPNRVYLGVEFVNNNAYLGSTPFQSPQFMTYFKVLKATHQLMAPGQPHVHRINRFKSIVSFANALTAANNLSIL